MLQSIGKLIPSKIRKKIWAIYFEHIKLAHLKNNILKAYTGHQKDEELQTALNYLAQNKINVLPYSEIQKTNFAFKVIFDAQHARYYVQYLKHKIYFRKKDDPNWIESYFQGLLKEQHPLSAHCYCDENFYLNDGDTLLDIGVAEGIFTLLHIDIIKKGIMIECDEEWIEALKLTFEPHKNKIEIITKYVSDKDDALNISIDNFLNTQKVDFLKVDVDGSELNLLKGAAKSINNKQINKIAITTYHKQEDAEDFKTLFNSKGYKTSFSKNYMLFIYDKTLAFPYFRKGILRCIANNV